MKRSVVITLTAAVVFCAHAVLAFDAKWARAVSSAGDFSVLLPKPFHEATGDKVAFGGTVVATGARQSFYVGGTPVPGINFLAAKLVYGSSSNARAAVSQMSLGEPPGYSRVYIRKGEVAGLPGIESKSLSASFVGYRRVLLSADAVFVLSVEAPADKDKEVESDVRKFFDSLHLEHK